MRRLSLLSIAVWFAACGDSASPDATVFPDAARDAGQVDRGFVDAAPDAMVDTGVDAGPVDTGPADTGPGDTGPTGILVPGITATVSVNFDEHGIPHLACQTNDDCFAAQGYLHAAHRFGQMDLRRRFVRGRLAELFGLAGQQVMDLDRNSRSFIATREGARLEERLFQSADAETRSAITAYTRGVNAWIADLRAGRNNARVTHEWPVGVSLIADWDVLDSAACMLGLLEDLTNESQFEILLGQIAAAMPPDQFFDLFGLLPASRSIIEERGDKLRFGEPPIFAALTSAQARLAAVRGLLSAAGSEDSFSLTSGGFGSNNWVIAPSASGGKTLLANDPHLGLDNAPIWYIVSMDAVNDIHIAGVSFAGVPGIILGHNENIAWGATTTVFDQADVYIETLTSSDTAVLFNGNPVALIERDFVFENSALGTITETFYYVPHHGPIVAFDRPNNRAISVRWVGHEADTDLNFLLPMARARTVTEARAALRNLTAAGQNFVVADTQGNIGWFPYSRVPERPWAQQFPPFLPLPGTGEAEWQGYAPYDDLPQMENPTQGWIATANNDMNGNLRDGDPTNDGRYIQHFVAPGYRQERIVQRIEEQLQAHDLLSMQEIQADVFSELGEDIVLPILALTATGLDTNGTLVAAALRDWDYECPTGLIGTATTSAPELDPTITAGSAGCMAFHALIGRLNRAVFDDEIAARGIDRRARIDALVTLLTRSNLLAAGPIYWDNVSTPAVETSTTIVTAAMNDAGAYLVREFGPVINDWRWGRKHTVSVTADFSSAVNLGPYANDGGLFTVDVANPRNVYADEYSHTGGPSMRFACELDTTDGVDCTIELPGGQRTFTDSPFFSDLLELWLINQPFTVFFDPAEVANASREAIEILPRP